MKVHHAALCIHSQPHYTKLLWENDYLTACWLYIATTIFEVFGLEMQAKHFQ